MLLMDGHDIYKSKNFIPNGISPKTATSHVQPSRQKPSRVTQNRNHGQLSSQQSNTLPT
jgi:hypothetical protein